MVTSFMWVVGNGATIRFPRKKVTFCFNHPRNPDADARSQGVRSSKDFEICGILEKEPRPVGHISYQVNQHGYLAKVKIESSAQMLDRVNNRSAWTVSQSLNCSQQKLLSQSHSNETN
jgi:hypothetical protein